MELDSSSKQIRALLGDPQAFSRLDETDDLVFFSHSRTLQPMDVQARHTVQELIDSLAIKQHPEILDLRAGIESFLSDNLEPARLVGIGINESELKANRRLTAYELHDLNRDPALPFPDNSFDIVINCLATQYLTRPVEVFREVNRVLRTGGLHLVIFSSRGIAAKTVRVWGELPQPERVELLRIYFHDAGGYTQPDTFVSMGRPRPAGDVLAGVPSDPVFAVYAEKGEATAHADRRHAPAEVQELPDADTLAQRKRDFVHTGQCPYCGGPMVLWAVTENPMSTWDHDFYICVNDACPYLVRGWRVMYEQGNPGVSYRLSFDPVSKTFSPISIPSLNAIKGQIKGDVYKPE